MIDKFLEQLKRVKQHIHLARERKAGIRAHLVEFMNTHRVVVLEPQMARFQMLTRIPSVAYAALLLVVISGGGVALGAQNALPGDPLYAVKVDITEKLGGALQFSSQAKAEYEVQLATRRLHEADKLVERGGEVSSQVQDDLANDFEAHVTRARENIIEVKTGGDVAGALQIANHFEENLRAREESKNDEAFNEVPTMMSERVPSLPAEELEHNKAPFNVTVPNAKRSPEAVPTSTRSESLGEIETDGLLAAPTTPTTSAQTPAFRKEDFRKKIRRATDEFRKLRQELEDEARPKKDN